MKKVPKAGGNIITRSGIKATSKTVNIVVPNASPAVKEQVVDEDDEAEIFAAENELLSRKIDEDEVKTLIQEQVDVDNDTETEFEETTQSEMKSCCCSESGITTPRSPAPEPTQIPTPFNKTSLIQSDDDDDDEAIEEEVVVVAEEEVSESTLKSDDGGTGEMLEKALEKVILPKIEVHEAEEEKIPLTTNSSCTISVAASITPDSINGYNDILSVLEKMENGRNSNDHKNNDINESGKNVVSNIRSNSKSPDKISELHSFLDSLEQDANKDKERAKITATAGNNDTKGKSRPNRVVEMAKESPQILAEKVVRLQYSLEEHER